MPTAYLYIVAALSVATALMLLLYRQPGLIIPFLLLLTIFTPSDLGLEVLGATINLLDLGLGVSVLAVVLRLRERGEKALLSALSWPLLCWLIWLSVVVLWSASGEGREWKAVLVDAKPFLYWTAAWVFAQSMDSAQWRRWGMPVMWGILLLACGWAWVTYFSGGLRVKFQQGLAFWGMEVRFASPLLPALAAFGPWLCFGPRPPKGWTPDPEPPEGGTTNPDDTPNPERTVSLWGLLGGAGAIVLVIGSSSRICLLMLGVSFLTALLLAGSTERRLLARQLGILLGVGLAALVLLWLARPEWVASKLEALEYRYSSLFKPQVLRQDWSTRWRMEELVAQSKLLSDHPLTGLGLAERYHSYRLSAGNAMQPVSLSQYTSFVHNGYLAITTKLGLPGFVLFCWMLLVAIIHQRGSVIQNPKSKIENVPPWVLWAALLSYAVGSLAAPLWAMDRYQMFFLFTLGALSVPRAPAHSAPQRPD